MNAALDSLQVRGEPILPEDIARLSPFGHRHINYLGYYNFNLPETLRDGKLRPFRAPDTHSQSSMRNRAE